MIRTFRFEELGYEVEVGKIAKQANGAVWFKHHGTTLLAAATSAPMTGDFPGFFPLTIDYRQQYAAAGKIPGGYFKREGKPTDLEVLTGRFIDRSLRPLFPYNFFDQVQILTTVYSINKEYTPNTLSLVASSLALVISDIPFMEAVGAVEIARVDGEWKFGPTYAQIVASDVRLIVAGTHEGICMVEGSFNELSEHEFTELLFIAHEKYIKPLVEWQNNIRQEIGKPKQVIADPFYWDFWTKHVEQFLSDQARVETLYHEDKLVRSQALKTLKEQFNLMHAQEITTKVTPSAVIDFIFDTVLKEKLTVLICARKKRVDGRDFKTIRHIAVEVGVLPFTHGSSLFTRGKTQALVTTTLGSGDDAQRLENLMEGKEETDTFLLHYNFLPFSSGEVRPSRGPGRREIGHGHLAKSAFRFVLPSQVDFPYTIRIVADILESDGSTSMATVCGATMSLMYAGVPITKMVAGIAMGLLYSKEDNTFIPLSDITGFEDAFGLMDFKVVGTANGITAIQMDIKHKGGITKEVFERALAQAKEGRLSILNTMGKVMNKPNEKLSDLVPKVVTLQISPDKIGAVIGSGGKTIREIIDATKTSIDIEDDGVVKIFGGPDADIPRAQLWVQVLAGKINKGSVFHGEVKRIAEFGLFVELVPGYDGLLHVSNIPKEIQKNLSKHFSVGQKITVEVLDHDETTSRTSLKWIKDQDKNNS